MALNAQSKRTLGQRALAASFVAFLAAPSGAQTLADPMLGIEPVASGFTSPSFFTFLPGPAQGPYEFLVCEIGRGRVLHYSNGALQGVALDLAVAYLFERGLFGIALHPDFAAAPYVYLYYTASNTGSDTSDVNGAAGNRVVRTRWNGATLDSLTVLLPLPVGTNHNGGALAFGPDGMLYGSIGEAGSTGGQLQNVATGTPPNDTSMLFRLRPDGSVPGDNPFIGQGGAIEKVYAYGIRNVFGLDFDPQTGALWYTDNGAATYDEVGRAFAGMNGGWRALMGPEARAPGALGDLWVAPGSAYGDPAFSFFQSFGITALHFQRGPALGAHYDGDLFVAAHNSMDVYHFDPTLDRTGLVMPETTVTDLVADDAAERDLFLWATDVGVVTDMETGPDGALYLLRYSGSAALYRVYRRATSDATAPRVPTQLVFSPNPFRDVTVLSSASPAGPADRLHVYTAAGRLVGILAPQAGRFVWDGTDGRGRRVPAGAYTVALRRGAEPSGCCPRPPAVGRLVHVD